MRYQYDYRSTISLPGWANMTIQWYGFATLDQHSPNVTFHLNGKPHWTHIVSMKHSVCHLLPTKPPSAHVNPKCHGCLGGMRNSKMETLSYDVNHANVRYVNNFNKYIFKCCSVAQSADRTLRYPPSLTTFSKYWINQIVTIYVHSLTTANL